MTESERSQLETELSEDEREIEPAEAETIQLEKELGENEEGLCTIRGRVTYVRGPVPLAKVTARPLTTTTNIETTKETSIPDETQPATTETETKTTTETDTATPQPATTETETPTAQTTTTGDGNTQPITTETAAPSETQPTTIVTDTATPQPATTDVAGAFQFAKLDPGVYEVGVAPPKDWKYQAKPQRIELAPGDVKEISFRLEKIVLEAIFEGRVLDADGAPALGAKVEGVLCYAAPTATTGAFNLESIITGSDGRFVFKNVVPGARFVRVMLPRHLGAVRDFNIEEGQTVSLEITLKKAAYRVYGTVTDESGKPCDATVRLYEEGVRQFISQKCETSKEDGMYEFYVNEGDCRILVEKTWYHFAAWTQPVSGDKQVDFQLRPIRPEDVPKTEYKPGQPEYEYRDSFGSQQGR